MSRITIEAEDLILALQSYDESESFLDRQTGEILFLVDEGIAGPNDELETLIDENPTRFLQLIQYHPQLDGKRWPISSSGCLTAKPERN